MSAVKQLDTGEDRLVPSNSQVLISPLLGMWLLPSANYRVKTVDLAMIGWGEHDSEVELIAVTCQNPRHVEQTDSRRWLSGDLWHRLWLAIGLAID